jgi:hypothetical protein
LLNLDKKHFGGIPASQGFDLSTQIVGALLMANFWPMPDL